MALGLHEAAHDAVHAMQRAIARIRRQRRDDGVVGALPRRDDIRVSGLQVEVTAAVLQDEAAARGDDGGAETLVVAVDEGDGVAVFV